MSKKTAIIIGAGPGGLTAALELVRRSGVTPIVIEMSDKIGGISRTINYKGNRMDIGGHRFFSKSDRVMDWWREIMPLQGKPSLDDKLLNRKIQLSEAADAPDPEKVENVMLTRNRLSRIFYLRKFFDYPISLSIRTLTALGPVRVLKIGFSYMKVRLLPKRKERNLTDFFINRFGKELYLTFFKDYTEKVWGVPCSQIDPTWGAQRIKGLSIMAALKHAFKSIFGSNSKKLAQKDVETSLIGRFMYPKRGPGQLWEKVAKMVTEGGGKILMNEEVVSLTTKEDKIVAVKTRNAKTGAVTEHPGDHFISTMPVKELVQRLDAKVPRDVANAASGLQYRDFITVGVLARKLKIDNRLRDNWIYIQERDVRIGRLQIFNNWSPYMVKDYRNTVWLGLEYFANEGDDLWSMGEKRFIDFAVMELEKIGILEAKEVLDATVVKVKKAYPSYFGTYADFAVIRNFLDGFINLYPVGRNGMHRYNNQDHSMLTAMAAAERIMDGKTDKSAIWDINTEKQYHEEKEAS